jgi:hypothetical protein
LNFHAFAAVRGEGIHPKLRLLFERAATYPVFQVAIRPDGFLQSGPDPASETAGDRVNASIFPQVCVPQMDEPNQNLETPPESLVALGR